MSRPTRQPPSDGPARARLAAGLLVAGLMTALLLAAPAPGWANPGHVDPASLPRGGDPRVAHLVADEIRDGDRRVPATTRGEHVDLWVAARGYVLTDWVQATERYRLTFVAPGGRQRLLARPARLAGAAVSPGGRRLAWAEERGRLGPPTVVTVVRPATGAVLASRRFHLAHVVAVSGSRVLLTLRSRDTAEATWWWDYRLDTLAQVSGDAARRADLRHDRVVLATGAEDSFCSRVAPLSDPAATLWSSCRVAPYRWSPGGGRALATHTYFDESGTDRWLTVGDRTGARLGLVAGRLGWGPAWEDNRHVLLLAQGDRGDAAVLRCTVAGRCERASRTWDVGWHGYPPYYLAPPVVLARN